MIKMNTLCLKTATFMTLVSALLSPFVLPNEHAVAQPVNLFSTEPPLAFQELQDDQGDTDANAAATSVLEMVDTNSTVEELPPPQESGLAPGADPTQDDESVDILARGPLHEAFAAVHQSNPEPSVTIAKAPPESIEELPPEFKPEGENVTWIPGYWAWDDSKDDFIWISGVWRDVPPSRKWVPGYWDEANGGFRWVSGFWTEEKSEEITYLPEPPASIDQGPSVAAPSDSHFYVPGNWSYQNDRYRWQSGHWQPVVKNYIWVPARYVWTPLGCIYQSGYWDYEIANRGTCFAPVYFQKPIYRTAHYHYRPTSTVTLNIDFLTHLFVRPNCGHYFYGDWYSKSFISFGYKPWVSYGSHFRRYDPLLAYYRCQRSSYDSRYNVVQYLANQHSFYANNQYYRPRTTYAAQLAFAQSARNTRNRDYITRSCYVRSYADVVRDRSRDLAKANRDLNRHQNRFARVQKQELAKQQKRIDQVLRLQRERQRVEVKALSRDIARKSANYNPKLKLKTTPLVTNRVVHTNPTIEKIRRSQERASRDARREIERQAARSKAEATKIARKNKDDVRRAEKLDRRDVNLARSQAANLQRERDAALNRKAAEKLAVQKERERKAAQKIAKAQRDRVARGQGPVTKSAKTDARNRSRQEVTKTALKRQQEATDRAAKQSQRDQQRLAQQRLKAEQDRLQQQRRNQEAAKRASDQQKRAIAQQRAKAEQDRMQKQRRSQDAAKRAAEQQRRASDSARRAADQQRRNQQAAQKAAQRQRTSDARKQQLKAQQDAARRASQAKQRQRQAERARQRAAQQAKKKKR